MKKKLNKIFKNAKKITIDDKSKIVIMSDCHRGNGNVNDKFYKNKIIYETALRNYYKNNFTYVELGDGDELWEVKNYNEIMNEYYSIFNILKNFNRNNRLIMIHGNHDISKKNNNILNNINTYESIILNYKNNKIFLLHGHQVDLLNSVFWYLSRFLVKHFWKFLKTIGINDPTHAAKNYKVKRKVEKRLEKWSIKNKNIVISGHTHRPIFPKVGNSMYFNAGSCIHPNGITCLEIENGYISLVKWSYKVKKDNKIFVGKSYLVKKELVSDFYKKLKK